MTCGALDGIVHLVEQAGERQDLTLADQLLVEVGVKSWISSPTRARHFGLLHAFGVRELFLAEAQHLTMVEGQREDADQQHGAQHHPEQARAVRESLSDGV